MTTTVAFLTAPSEPFVPAALQGQSAVAVLLCHAGDPAQGEDLVNQLRSACQPDADVVGLLPYPVLQGMLDKGAPHGGRAVSSLDGCGQIATKTGTHVRTLAGAGASEARSPPTAGSGLP